MYVKESFMIAKKANILCFKDIIVDNCIPYFRNIFILCTIPEVDITSFPSQNFITGNQVLVGRLCVLV